MTTTREDADDLSVLRALYAASGFCASSELRRRTALSPRDLRASFDRLRAAGCRFDHHPQLGFRLVEAGIGVVRLWLAEALGDAEEAREAIHVYRRTSSTQDRAREALQGGTPPAVVLADAQTAGRGRLGRRWDAPAGSSLLLTLPLPVTRDHGESVDPVTALVAVALVQAIRAVTPARPALKWPNDVMLATGGDAGLGPAHGARDAKLAGILVERAAARRGGDHWLVGIGLNVNRPAAPHGGGTPGAAWLSDACGGPLDRLPLLTEIVRQARRWTARNDPDRALGHWRQWCTTLGRRLTFRTGGRTVTGDVLDVDLHAGLIVRTDTGELTHLPAATTTVAADAAGP